CSDIRVDEPERVSYIVCSIGARASPEIGDFLLIQPPGGVKTDRRRSISGNDPGRSVSWDTGGMYTLELYARVRRAVQVEGKSERQVAREYGLARETVRKM